MTEGPIPEAVPKALDPSAVVPTLLVMASEDVPNRTIICAGSGRFEVAHIALIQGVHLGTGADTAEQLLATMAQVTDRQGEMVPRADSEQGTLEVGKAMRAHGV